MRNPDAQVPAVVDALVSAGLLDATRRDDAQRVVVGVLGEPEKKASSRTLLVEIAAYVGGALVVASVGLFLAQYWTRFSGAVQVSVLALIAVLLAAAGLAVSRVGTGYAELRAGRDEMRRRLTSALLSAASVATGITVGRAVDLQVSPETGGGNWPLVAGTATVVLLAAAAYAYAPSVLGQLVIAAGLFNLTTTTWSMLDSQQESTVGPGLVFLAIGLLWVGAAERGVFHEQAPARAIGAALALFGAQFVRFGGEYNNLSYLLLLLVAVGAFAMYLRTASWPYLVVGVLGVTLVVPEAIIDWTGGSLGPAGGVLIAGVTLLGASLAGLRVRREVTEETDVEESREVRPRRPVGR
ncbi:MAG TPA: hypothetical protein PLP61_07015 [Nocardioides sp.]|uniref:hypothetical protein n=1 Tax=Nocardioides sp. TaxID=35761 RepID=UPI002C538483|nr:hypothetical protein [Nocardioides sp.]HQR26775.1 hypothetical protein [Nocardioides sp.]